MVYISNGRLQERPPLNMETFYNFFWGAVFVVIQFFQSLVGLDEGGPNTNRGGFRGGSGGGGGGGGNGGHGGGNGPGGFKHMGNVKSITDYSSPGGGCSGGGCFR